MTWILVQPIGSCATPLSLGVEKIHGVSGMDGMGQSSVHLDGGETYHVLESLEDLRARINKALEGTD